MLYELHMKYGYDIRTSFKKEIIKLSKKLEKSLYFKKKIINYKVLLITNIENVHKHTENDTNHYVSLTKRRYYELC